MWPPFLTLLRSIGWSAALFAGAAPLAQAQTDPAITLSRIEAVRLQGERGSLDLALDVQNRHSISLEMQTVKFRLFLGSTEVGQGQSMAPVRIPAGGRALLPVRVDVERVPELAMTLALSAGRQIPYVIKGIAEVGLTGLPVPFTYSGMVNFGR